MTVAEHLESYLGEIEAGWSRDADHAEMPFQVVRFGQGCAVRTVGFATLGLSGFALRSPTSGKEIRQE